MDGGPLMLSGTVPNQAVFVTIFFPKLIGYGKGDRW
jgi:hypothetical protein